jgi:RNA polymerase-binding protein DksA
MQDDERAHYRETLLKLRSRLTDELHKAVDRVADKAAPPDELSHVPTHAADRDSEGLDRDIAVQANREQMLEAIEDALERINDGTFGRCEDCQGDIGKARLDVLPFAARCVECEKKQEKT